MARIYGKLIDGELVLREKNSVVNVGGVPVVSNDPEILLQDGYKLVITSEPPDDTYTDFDWQDNGECICQVWKKSSEEELMADESSSAAQA